MMLTPEELQHIENLIWTGEDTNLELAQQLAKGLGMNEIPLLKNLFSCFSNIYKNGKCDFLRFIKSFRESIFEMHCDFPANLSDENWHFLGKYIQNLSLRGATAPADAQTLSQTTLLPQLRQLIIEQIYQTTPPLSLKYPALEQLTIQAFSNVQIQAPKLKCLIIKYLESEQVPILEQLKNFPQLEHIKIHRYTHHFEYGRGSSLYEALVPYDYDYQLVIDKINKSPNIIQIQTSEEIKL